MGEANNYVTWSDLTSPQHPHRSGCEHGSQAGFGNILETILELAPNELDRYDLAVLNLLCAPALPGSETLDIAKCIARLDRLAMYVKSTTEKNLHTFSLLLDQV